VQGRGRGCKTEVIDLDPISPVALSLTLARLMFVDMLLSLLVNDLHSYDEVWSLLAAEGGERRRCK